MHAQGEESHPISCCRLSIVRVVEFEKEGEKLILSTRLPI